MGNLFTKKNNLSTLPYDPSNQHTNYSNNYNRSIMPNSIPVMYKETPEDLAKWRPNDELYHAYNKYIEEVSKLRQYENKINSLKEKKEYYKELSEIDCQGDKMKELDKYNAKSELITILSEIASIEEKVKIINNTNSDILDKWFKYNEEINKFIQDNKLGDFVNARNLYCSTNLYAFIQLLTRDTIFVNETEETYTKLGRIGAVVNIKHLVNKQTINKQKLEAQIKVYEQITNVIQPVSAQYESFAPVLLNKDNFGQISNLAASNEPLALLNLNPNQTVPINNLTNLLGMNNDNNLIKNNQEQNDIYQQPEYTQLTLNTSNPIMVN
jgi:hypothetical protein